MGNTHEYVIFDRAKLRPILAMRWPDFVAKHLHFNREENFVDEELRATPSLLKRLTVRGLMFRSLSPFLFLRQVLDECGLLSCGRDVEFYADNGYAEAIVGCACAAYQRRDISMADLSAVYFIHACGVIAAEAIPPELQELLDERPEPPPMMPGLGGLRAYGTDSLGPRECRRFANFLREATQRNWPIDSAKHGEKPTRKIRTCAVAVDLARSFRTTARSMKEPCIFRWYGT